MRARVACQTRCSQPRAQSERCTSPVIPIVSPANLILDLHAAAFSLSPPHPPLLAPAFVPYFPSFLELRVSLPIQQTVAATASSSVTFCPVLRSRSGVPLQTRESDSQISLRLRRNQSYSPSSLSSTRTLHNRVAGLSNNSLLIQSIRDQNLRRERDLCRGLKAKKN